MDIDGNGIVKVPGVLNLNEEIRQELLKRIYWKDRVYTNFGGAPRRRPRHTRLHSRRHEIRERYRACVYAEGCQVRKIYRSFEG